MNLAFVVTVSSSIEARKVSSGKTIAWMAIGFCAAFALGLSLVS